MFSVPSFQIEDYFVACLLARLPLITQAATDRLTRPPFTTSPLPPTWTRRSISFQVPSRSTSSRRQTGRPNPSPSPSYRPHPFQSSAAKKGCVQSPSGTDQCHLCFEAKGRKKRRKLLLGKGDSISPEAKTQRNKTLGPRPRLQPVFVVVVRRLLLLFSRSRLLDHGKSTTTSWTSRVDG